MSVPWSRWPRRKSSSARFRTCSDHASSEQVRNLSEEDFLRGQRDQGTDIQQTHGQTLRIVSRAGDCYTCNFAFLMVFQIPFALFRCQWIISMTCPRACSAGLSGSAIPGASSRRCGTSWRRLGPSTRRPRRRIRGGTPYSSNGRGRNF